MIDLSKITGFEWDAGNARKNERHGVSAGEAEEVLFSPRLLLLDDQRHSQEEPRYHALGVTAAGRRLHVSFTLRRDGTAIRVISARDMSRKERAIYEKAPKEHS
ncbi:MAG: BrnT family toxin [Steroidobacteraceae bacterium]